MLKFHVANAIWMESHFWNYVKAKKKKNQKKTLFVQTGNITKSEKVRTF